MHVRRASEFSLAELTRFWNLGYTDYFSPVTFTEPMMESWIKAGDFDLDRCLVQLDGDALVGFSMLGVRDDRGWIGGFGVAPDYRGKGVAYSLFADHVSRLAGWGMKHVQLEVLVQNWAWKVYAKAGFAITRRLSVLKGALHGAGAAAAQAAPLELLAHSDRLHAEHPACWQRQVPHLTKSMPETAVGLYTGPLSAPTGFVIGASNGSAVRLTDAAAESSDAATALVQGLADLFPAQGIVVLNEPEGSPMHAALTAIAGAAELHGQHEMHWEAGRA